MRGSHKNEVPSTHHMSPPTMAGATGTGETSDATPIIPNKLKMLQPTDSPWRGGFPRRLASKLTTSSGSDVPIATNVSPLKCGGQKKTNGRGWSPPRDCTLSPFGSEVSRPKHRKRSDAEPPENHLEIKRLPHKGFGSELPGPSTRSLWDRSSVFSVSDGPTSVGPDEGV